MEAVYRQIAQKLREEMVCCPTYEQIEKVGFVEADYRALKRSSNYHAICHYGEWAARIVEAMGKQDVRDLHEPL